MASEEAKSSQYDASTQQYWAAMQQQQMYQQHMQPGGYTPEQQQAAWQQQQWALQQQQVQAQAAYYGIATQLTPEQQQQQQAMLAQQQQMNLQMQQQMQQQMLMQQLQGVQQAQMAQHGVVPAVYDPNAQLANAQAAQAAQAQAMQAQEYRLAGYDPNTAAPPLFHRSEPGQTRHMLRLNIFPWLRYRTLYLLAFVALAVACVASPLLRLSFLENPENEPQGLRALLYVLVTYGLARVVILMWGRAHPFSKSAAAVGLLADAAPVVIVITSGLSAWFQPHQVKDITDPDVTSASYKIATICDIICRYGFLFCLVPFLFDPWAGMKAPKVPTWRCEYCGTANVAPANGVSSQCVACCAFHANSKRVPDGAATDAQPATATDAAIADAPAPVIVSQDGDGAGDGAGAGADAGAGAGAGADAAETAAAEAGRATDGDGQDTTPDMVDVDVSASGQPKAPAVPSVGSGDDHDNAGEVAVEVKPGSEAATASADAPQVQSVAVQQDTVMVPDPRAPGIVSDGQGIYRRKATNNRPKVVSNVVSAAIIFVGMLSEILRIFDAWPAALSAVLVVPWAFLAWYDHGRRSWGSPAYLNLCLFTMYYLPSYGGLAFLGSMVEHHGETGAELLVLAVWVVALFVVQWLWNVSSSRAMTPIDAWPLTFHLDLFIEMLHRMILLQLAPFEGVFFAFIILHALVGVVRHSDLGTMVTRKVFGIKRNLMDASDWALTADRLEERSLRCQAGFVASALASLVSFIAVGGDAVLNFGDPGVTFILSSKDRNLQLAGLAVTFVVSLAAYIAARTILRRRINNELQIQYAENWANMDDGVRKALQDIATPKRMSWSWDTYVWVFCSGVVFCLIQPLMVASWASHGTVA